MKKNLILSILILSVLTIFSINLVIGAPPEGMSYHPYLYADNISVVDSSYLRITNDTSIFGNLGIGTDSPVTDLDVESTNIGRIRLKHHDTTSPQNYDWIYLERVDNLSVQHKFGGLMYVYPTGNSETSFSMGLDDSMILYTYNGRNIGINPTGGNIILGDNETDKVGIGTNTPDVKLDVETSSGDGALEVGSSLNSATGGYSVAMGSDTNASGYVSVAIGSGTTASNGYSVAMGSGTTASGGKSTAMGALTTASGTASTAMGASTTASGTDSTAMGYGTTASGLYSTAMGRGIEAGGDYSVAIALNNQNSANVSDPNTMAIMGGKVGIGTTSPDVKLDVETSSGDGGALEVGDSSNSATGDYAVAMGSYTSASGFTSTAMGSYTTASGLHSTAMGSQTVASGVYSTAMGWGTTASGDISTAIGEEIEAGGANSVAIALNDQDGANVSNANTMAIMGGNVGIGRVDPSVKLDVEGTLQTDGFSCESGDCVSGSDVDESSLICSNIPSVDCDGDAVNDDIASCNDVNNCNLDHSLSDVLSDGNSAGSHNIDMSGNNIIGINKIKGSEFLYTSDRRLKKNINNLQLSLDKVADLQGVEFNWKDDKDNTKKQLGLIAQDVEKVYPELVSTDEEGMKSLQYANLVAPLVESVKELKEINDEQSQEIDELRNELEKLKEEIK